MVRTSNNRVMSLGNLYCCLLPQCEVINQESFKECEKNVCDFTSICLYTEFYKIYNEISGSWSHFVHIENR